MTLWTDSTARPRRRKHAHTQAVPKRTVQPVAPEQDDEEARIWTALGGGLCTSALVLFVLYVARIVIAALGGPRIP